jgi:hypothetical protein
MDKNNNKSPFDSAFRRGSSPVLSILQRYDENSFDYKLYHNARHKSKRAHSQQRAIVANAVFELVGKICVNKCAIIPPSVVCCFAHF